MRPVFAPVPFDTDTIALKVRLDQQSSCSRRFLCGFVGLIALLQSNSEGFKFESGIEIFRTGGSEGGVYTDTSALEPLRSFFLSQYCLPALSANEMMPHPVLVRTFLTALTPCLSSMHASFVPCSRRSCIGLTSIRRGVPHGVHIAASGVLSCAIRRWQHMKGDTDTL